ncbi:MAG: DUF6152 family protein [Steroidobacteraceae bacterium]
MRTKIAGLALAALSIGAGVSGPASAHHSGAMFDDQKTIVLQGAVAEFNWTNPHSSIKVEVANAQGKTDVWAIEMNSPGNLVREGWKRSSLKPGDKVAILVHPLRDGKPGAIYLAIRLADGTMLAPGGSGHDKTLAAALTN